MSLRVQCLSAQISKRVFDSSEFGIVRCADLVHGVEEFGFKPLVILGISYEGLPIHFSQFYRQNENICPEQFLIDFWSTNLEKDYPNHPVSGKPDCLVIDEVLQNSLEPSFYEWLQSINVEYKFTQGKNRKLSALSRQHQRFPVVGTDHHVPTASVGKDESYPLTLDVLNNEQKFNIFDSSTLSKYIRGKFKAEFHKDFAPAYQDFNCEKKSVLKLTFPQDKRPTQNEVEMHNPHWQKSSNTPVFSYGYLINNFEAAELSVKRVFQEELGIALRATEYQWKTYPENLQIRLKQCRISRFRKFDMFTDQDYIELLYLTGIDQEQYFIHNANSESHPSERNTLVYDISRLTIAQISKLWRFLVGKPKNSFKVVSNLENEKRQKYELFTAVNNKQTFIFIGQLRYNKGLAFTGMYCSNFDVHRTAVVDDDVLNKSIVSAFTGDFKAISFVSKLTPRLKFTTPTQYVA